MPWDGGGVASGMNPTPIWDHWDEWGGGRGGWSVYSKVNFELVIG
jgi:hypothetical protein